MIDWLVRNNWIQLLVNLIVYGIVMLTGLKSMVVPLIGFNIIWLGIVCIDIYHYFKD